MKHTEHTQLPKPLMTLDEVIRWLRISRTTANRWRNNGLLPAIKLPSGLVRYRREDIEQILHHESEVA